MLIETKMEQKETVFFSSTNVAIEEKAIVVIKEIDHISIEIIHMKQPLNGWWLRTICREKFFSIERNQSRTKN